MQYEKTKAALAAYYARKKCGCYDPAKRRWHERELDALEMEVREAFAIECAGTCSEAMRMSAQVITLRVEHADMEKSINSACS
jgi:hypothetical protein